MTWLACGPSRLDPTGKMSRSVGPYVPGTRNWRCSSPAADLRRCISRDSGHRRWPGILLTSKARMGHRRCAGHRTCRRCERLSEAGLSQPEPRTPVVAVVCDEHARHCTPVAVFLARTLKFAQAEITHAGVR